MKRTGPIKVLIVDDSPFVRTIFAQVLSTAADMVVVGGAKNPFEARNLIIQHRPDVIILDIEMPRMDGLTFLRKLMVHYPVPVIMCSGVPAGKGLCLGGAPSPSGSQAALEAFAIGAVDVVCKPASGDRQALRALATELVDKVRAAADSLVRAAACPQVRRNGAAAPRTSGVFSRVSSSASFRGAGLNPDRYLVVIGASTGGTEAIRRVLSSVPEDFPPTAIVQHMPEGFTASFAERLNQLSPITVTEAVHNDELVAGRAFLARGGRQMMVRATAGSLRIQYGTQELVNRHCPSVDVLFESACDLRGRQVIGVLLTGMGDDGARGLLALRQAGAITFGQDRESCVVYGMPKVAFELGAVQQQACPEDMARLILEALLKGATHGSVQAANTACR